MSKNRIGDMPEIVGAKNKVRPYLKVAEFEMITRTHTKLMDAIEIPRR